MDLPLKHVNLFAFINFISLIIFAAVLPQIRFNCVMW